MQLKIKMTQKCKAKYALDLKKKKICKIYLSTYLEDIWLYRAFKYMFYVVLQGYWDNFINRNQYIGLIHQMEHHYPYVCLLCAILKLKPYNIP